MHTRKEEASAYCLITFPYDRIYPGPMNILHALRALNSRVFLISGDVQNDSIIPDIVLSRIVFPKWYEKLPWPVRFILREISTGFKTIRNVKNTSTYVVYQTNVILTSFLCRLLRRRVLQFVGGSGFQSEFSRGETILSRLRAYLLFWLEKLAWRISNKIVIQASTMINDAGISKFQNKIVTGGNFPGPTFHSKFSYKKPFTSRRSVIGFVGRLETEKGVIAFVKSIPKILERRPDVEFLIVGDGSLRCWINEQINQLEKEQAITLTGFVPHQNVGQYLNEMRLLVLPSLTEGLPKIVLEAQSCGTPVLATNVGGIEEIITHKETGFILDSLTKENLVTVIIRLLDDPKKLEEVSKNAQEKIMETYKFKNLVCEWREILF